jgi:hypothetical protein
MNIRYVACALLSVSLGTVVWAADGREEAATETASAWLTLLDQAKYADAWEGVAKDGQDIGTQESFTRTMASMARKRGKITARSVSSATDDGTRVVVEFAVFQNKAGTTTETVTLVQEPDGSWKVTKHGLQQRSGGVTTRR